FTVYDTAAPVIVVGGAGSDKLTIDRTADTEDRTGATLTATDLTGLGIGGVTFSTTINNVTDTVEDLALKLGTGVVSLAGKGTPTTPNGSYSTLIDTNTADDTLTVTAVGDSTTVRGAPGKDTVIVQVYGLPTANQFTNLHLAVQTLKVDNTLMLDNTPILPV